MFIFFDFIIPLFYYLFIILAVAFLTLLERKVISYSQSRKGPNIVGPLGVIQPIGDAIKLLLKETNKPLASYKFFYFSSSLIIFFLSFLLWSPFYYSPAKNLENVFFFFLCIGGLGVLVMMISGWASNSSYSMIGGSRAVVQMISYEVALSFILLVPLMLLLSFNFKDLFFLSKTFYFLSFFTLMGMWIICLLAETNRAPFDLTESESELVSGFNTEYSSGPFALFFLGEYSSIMFMSFIMSIFFESFYFTFFFFSTYIVFVETIIFSTVVIWIRTAFPRKRYDFMINFLWTSIFPFLMSMLFFFFLFLSV